MCEPGYLESSTICGKGSAYSTLQIQTSDLEEGIQVMKLFLRTNGNVINVDKIIILKFQHFQQILRLYTYRTFSNLVQGKRS